MAEATCSGQLFQEDIFYSQGSDCVFEIISNVLIDHIKLYYQISHYFSNKSWME